MESCAKHIGLMQHDRPRKMSPMERYIHDFATQTPSAIAPDYPRWDAFFAVLVMKLKVRQCDHTFRNARHILGRLTCVDVEGTISELEKLGAHCDCEILFNIK